MSKPPDPPPATLPPTLPPSADPASSPPLPPPPVRWVVATRVGFYGGHRRRPGDPAFALRDPADFAPGWMVPAPPEPPPEPLPEPLDAAPVPKAPVAGRKRG